MSVFALGYIGLETAGLEDWSGFATDVLGLQHQVQELSAKVEEEI